ncbi:MULTISPECIES: hypothetical protein [Gammaproteobacteria]|jgi:hypothetical protein|uniref:Uncharacterized protein n=1 Tax=Pseudomonas putida TaxID=303 RepID=A0A177SCD3_PSEPU|nr:MULTISPECIES: hypothetical protein [Gammaproteobacteria]MBH1448464.1 hypothetical protein [Stenotrophomonas maltophilia]MCB7145410.1 hypothetical protein [Stenotrophomonas maltophilia]OAI84598.1 hypothetical protein AYO28_26775 [Pseudomonas putida]
MDLADRLHGVQVRAPFQAVGRPLFRHVGCAIHVGYENSIRAALAGESPDANWQELTRLLVEHLASGEKMVKAVLLSSAQKTVLRDWIRQRTTKGGPLATAFPGVAPKADLVTHQHSDPAEVGWLDLVDGVAALYTSSRMYLRRVELAQSNLKDGAADGFEVVYAMKREFVQTYDALYLPTDGDWALICTDFPRGVPGNFAVPSQANIAYQLRKALGGSISYVNFWPAVEGLYKSAEGKLVDYGFVVEGKAVNHHAARRISESLRDAKYDKAGAKEVGDDLDVFKVSIQWQFAHPGQPKTVPEITLPGTAHHLATGKVPVLDHVIVRNCLTSSDMSSVMSKVRQFL